MKKKKNLYVVPDVKLMVVSDIMQTVPFSPNPDDPVAKEQKEFIEEEEPLPVDKNIWEDEEE